MPAQNAHDRTLELIDRTPQVIDETTTLDDSYANKVLYHLSMASGETLTLTLPPIGCALVGVPYTFVCTVDGGGGATFTVQDRDDSIDSGQDISKVFKDKGDNLILMSTGSNWATVASDLTA